MGLDRVGVTWATFAKVERRGADSGSGFRVLSYDFGLRVSGLACAKRWSKDVRGRVLGAGRSVESTAFRVYGVGCRV